MPLQKPFVGLLDHLGQFSGGNLRFEPSPVIQPAVSAEDFINPVEDLFTAGTLTAVNQVATHLAVPESELWRVRYWAVRGLDANNTTSWAPVWSDDGSRFFGLDTEQNTAKTQSIPTVVSHAGRTFDGQEGFILRPRERLGWLLYTSLGPGAGVAFTTLIRYQKIKT